jgi:CBS domain-containing protein
MRVQDLIKTKGETVIAVAENVRIKDAVKIMHKERIGALVVLASGNQLKGVISEREIIVALAEYGELALDLCASDLMLLDRPVVGPSDSVRDVMTIMTERRARHLPVLMEGTVVALISVGDTIKARLSEKIAENMVLQDIARWPAASVA